jgi:hypothetical protein
LKVAAKDEDEIVDAGRALAVLHLAAHRAAENEESIRAPAVPVPASLLKLPGSEPPLRTRTSLFPPP